MWIYQIPVTIKNLERAKNNNLNTQNSKNNVFKYLAYEDENILKSELFKNPVDIIKSLF